MRQHVPALDSGRVAKKSSGIGRPGFWLQLRTYIRSMSMLPPACRQAPIFYGDAWLDRKSTGKGVREVRRRRQPFSIEFASANSGDRGTDSIENHPPPFFLPRAKMKESR